MEAETEAVRATTIEIAHSFWNIRSPNPTRQVNTGPAGCRARPQPKEKVLCGPVTNHHYISLQWYTAVYSIQLYSSLQSTAVYIPPQKAGIPGSFLPCSRNPENPGCRPR